MNPNKRQLIRLSINDIEADVGQFNILHGRKDNAKSNRKKLMEFFRLSREDFDN
jgi:hypothetical protein